MNSRVIYFAWVKFIFCLMMLQAVSLPAFAKRLALVIGNDNYTTTSVPKLKKAGNDATAMATELRKAGFEVSLHKDLTFRAMVQAVDSFTAGITGGDEVVVFFAGHGIQLKSGNYLLPTDIEPNSPSEIEKTAYALDDLKDKLSDAKPAFSLLIADACRSPLESKGRAIGGGRGLSPVEPAKGQMVVYSASRGQEALDRLTEADPNPNSVFTREFIVRMKQPGVRIEEIVREVQDAVEKLAKTVKHEQRPALYNEARGSFYFYAPKADQSNTLTANSSPVINNANNSDLEREEKFWNEAKAVGNKEAFEAYLKKYPNGIYLEFAKANIAKYILNIEDASCFKDKSVNTLMSFSTMSGAEAEDGIGKNGLYTEVLINELKKASIPIEDLFSLVTSSVKNKTRINQTPFLYTNLKDCLNQLSFKDLLKNYPKKYAVIIGNSSYTKVSPLANAINDSNEIKQYFAQQKFTIFQKNNFTRKDIPLIFSELKKQLSPDSVFVFYYAGHAVEINQVNYFLPVDAEVSSEDDIKKQSLKLDDLVDTVSSTKSNLNLYFIDASRNNPFSSNTSR